MAGEKGVELKYKEDLDIGDVQKYLADAQLQATKKGSTTLAQAKLVFDRTLQCIQSLGEVVAGGAAYVVGGPANTCYNALSFVINAYQAYNGIFESLANLLERCLDFLDRLVNYRKMTMDANLKHIACKQLELFIDVCDHTLKLRHNKLSRVFATAKIVFLKDDGVQEFLARMQRLNEKELGLVASQTLLAVDVVDRGVSNVQKGVDNLGKDFRLSMEQQNEDRSEQKTEKDKKKWKATFLRVLGWPESDLRDSPDGKVPRRVWETRWRQHMEQVGDETGKWLESNHRFLAWAHDANHDLSVLGIEGSEGSGKTHLAANIIKRLQQPRGPSTRSSVAYYFMETDSKAKSASKTEVAATVTRSLLWQLTESYQPFLKSAAGICDKEGAIGGPLEMWKRFVLYNEERSNMDNTFFIIIDGLSEDAHAAFLRPLLLLLKNTPTARKKTRILITGNPTYFTALGDAGDIGLQTIKLGHVNLRDIELFIERGMDGIDMLQDRSRAGVSQMRARILDTLKASTGGDYRKIDLVLTEIDEKDDEPQINGCLERAGKAAADQIATIIQTLNETSTPNDISDINEMILWIINGATWLTPLQMEGVLSLKARASSSLAADDSAQPSDTHTTTFRSLESKIRNGRYSLFELVEANDEFEVKFKDSTSIYDATERIPHKSRNTDDIIGDLKTIQPAEVRMVKHYLKTVCPDDIYDKFGFADFFEQKLVRKKNFICQDPDNAELTLALRCLTCLVDERVRKTEVLHSYAARLFLEDYGINSLFGIGCPFDDDEGKSALAQRELPESWNTWVVGNTGLDVLARYLKDRAVLEGIKDSDLVKAFSATDENKSLSLLRPALNTAVRHLLRADATSREVENAFLFLLAAEAKLEIYEKNWS
ncbi:hypothetical protein ColLi_11445 [Colletotrichum liriopes]|uniref:Fungal STAND N-terminal Goodbye domain-containing protein n=1 Tax=Colletotrichum liriopes TaxID=708192 RepID=A0AA37GYE4_9PEZI|nr:hypothetical protein ColLi_11445 [Colletotrichum liriopes]